MTGKNLRKSLGHAITTYFERVEPIKLNNDSKGKKNKKNIKYLNLFSAFDIETSKLEDIKQSFMYVWQFAFGIGDDINYIVGRDWKQFVDLLRIINETLDEDTRLVCHVHNLSYEFCFLSGILPFGIDDVFCADRRKVLKAVYGSIEFRCSYILTNMDLHTFTDSMNVKHKKLSGDEFNYNIVRYPWTELTERELEYCLNDVIGLIEALQVYYRIENDTHYSIPMTSTGFVRRDLKNAIRKGVSHKYMVNIQPDIYLFDALRDAFRGGNTHANIWQVSAILEEVHSADRSSSYPDVMCNRLCPISKFKYIGLQTFDQVKHLIDTKHALLMRVSFSGVQLKNECWGFPYIPIIKCQGIKPKDCVMDNGRVRYTECEFMMTITDVDLDIILQEYDTGTIVFLEVWSSVYGELPKCVKDTIIKYYRLKTELKGVESDDGSTELLYSKSKAKINACYGCCVQDVTKVLTVFDQDHYDELGQLDEYHPDTENCNREEILKKYSSKGFLPYQWGVWVTAWARWELEEGLKCIPDPLNAVYVDTDSIKYIGDIDLSKYNERCIANSTKNGAYATDPKGNTHYMGVFEEEDTALRFRTHGAKKYCSEYAPDKKHDHNYLKLTCAGVNKKLGAEELEEHDGIYSFEDGFKFIKGGGTTSIYNDDIDEYVNIDGHRLHITKNVCIVDDFYTLGKTGEYERLLQVCAKYVDIVISGAKITISTEIVHNNLESEE